MIKINDTLLLKLFLEPNPQPGDKEVICYYKKLYSRMFPNPDDYITFLKSQSIDRQYESAERIVHRLCYHSNFPPSYYSLLDIICVENYQEKGILDSDSYIPRDHFIHTVYLYLLGIYIFFYNSEFYTKIVTKNRFERKGFSVGNVKHDCIKDFISEWKYFSLYHDIGYSAEILGNVNKFSNRKKALKELQNNSGNYKASLGKNAILKQHTYLGTLEIISKFIFSKLVISNSTEKINTEHRIYRSYRKKLLKLYNSKNQKTTDIKFDDIPEKLLSGVQLEKIYSNHCLKKILPIISSNDIVIIGLEKDSGHVGFITYSENDARIFIYPNSYKVDNEFSQLLTMPDIVLFDDYLPQTYEFIYILKNTNIDDNISAIVDIDYFNSVYNQAEKQFENDFKGIADESHFIDFSYIIYHWLFIKIKKRLDNTALETYLDTQKFEFASKSQVEITEDLLNRNKLIRKRILESLDEYHPVLLSKCNELLQKIINDVIDKPEKITSPSKMLSKYVDQYYQVLTDITTDVSLKEIFLSDLSSEILLQIEEEVNLLQLFSQIFVQLKSTLNKTDSWFEYNYITGKAEISCFLDESIQKIVQEKMSITDTATVENDYILKHGNTVDHGIISSQYAASVFSCYRNALQKARHKQEKLLLSVLLDMPNGIDESRVRYIDNYDHVFTNVLFAVFVHNLYPSQFKEDSKGAEYKTKMSDPFTYLSLLCDALQQWNRPRSLHPSLFESHPLIGASEEYDIDIKGNCIFLSDTGTNLSQWFEHNLSILDTYLANIKAFLKQKL